MAEREGFEPTVPVTQYARLATRFRPADKPTPARLTETLQDLMKYQRPHRYDQEMSD